MSTGSRTLATPSVTNLMRLHNPNTVLIWFPAVRWQRRTRGLAPGPPAAGSTAAAPPAAAAGAASAADAPSRGGARGVRRWRGAGRGGGGPDACVGAGAAGRRPGGAGGGAEAAVAGPPRAAAAAGGQDDAPSGEYGDMAADTGPNCKTNRTWTWTFAWCSLVHGRTQLLGFLTLTHLVAPPPVPTPSAVPVLAGRCPLPGRAVQRAPTPLPGARRTGAAGAAMQPAAAAGGGCGGGGGASGT